MMLTRGMPVAFSRVKSSRTAPALQHGSAARLKSAATGAEIRRARSGHSRPNGQ
jgi:hypothetical protein